MTEPPHPPTSEQSEAASLPFETAGLASEVKPVHHFLVQAPVPALDVDGLNLVTIGLVLFGAGSVITGLLYGRLEQAGNGWWFGVCISGFVLGLIGLAYCWNRRRRRRAGLWDRD